MDGLRQYVISVVSAALICGILSALTENGTGKVLIRLLCGLFLTFTAVCPLMDADLEVLTEYTLLQSLEAERAVFSGEAAAKEAMMDIIKAETEAYILDKASTLNAELTVQVRLDENNVPAEAVLSGKISPYAKVQLEMILESELGITKENQIWSG